MMEDWQGSDSLQQTGTQGMSGRALDMAQRFGQVSSGARKSSRQRSHTLSPTSAGGGGGMTGDFLGVYDVPASPAVPVSSPSSPVASPAQPGRGGASCTFTIASADSASEPGSAGLWKGSAPPKSPPKAATEDATPAVLSPERVGTVRRLSRGIEAHTPPRKARPVIEAASPVVKRSLSLQSPNSPVPKGARTAWRDGDPTSPGSGAGGPSTPPSVSPAKRRFLGASAGKPEADNAIDPVTPPAAKVGMKGSRSEHEFKAAMSTACKLAEVERAVMV